LYFALIHSHLCYCPTILSCTSISNQNKLAKIQKKAIYDYAPKSFMNTWQKNEERLGDYNLRNDDLYMLPVPRIEFFKRMPIYSLPAEWNNAEELKYYENKITFRHALKEKLLFELVPIDEN